MQAFFKVTTISAFRSSDPSRHRRLSVFGFAGSDQQPEADLPQVLPAQAEGRRLLLHRLRLVPQSAHKSQDLRHLDGHVSVALRLGWLTEWSLTFKSTFKQCRELVEMRRDPCHAPWSMSSRKTEPVQSYSVAI